MSTPYRRFLAAAAAAAGASILVVLIAAGAAVAGESKSGEEQKQAAALRKVEAKHVCMVNDQLFDKDLIPIEVEAKTYYGCCMMCKERLAKDAEVRSAVDPLTGKKVDKARAVIAARADGSVLYFESEETLARYQRQQAEKER